MASMGIFSPAQVNRAMITSFGALNVSVEGTSLFNDQFNGSALDTVNNWKAPVVAGAGAVTVAGGKAILSVGTGASSAVAITSIESFAAVGAGCLRGGTILVQEAGAIGLLPLNVNAFHGVGLPNPSYTAATPLLEATGFERTIDGKYSVVVYANAVRTVILDLTLKILDGFPHVLSWQIRQDVMYFYLDNGEEHIAFAFITSPQTGKLPYRAHVINHTVGPAVAPTFVMYGAGIIDSGNNYTPVYNGQTVQAARSPNIFIPINAVSIAASVAIWTPITGKKFRLMGYVLESGTVGGNVLLQDGVGGTTLLIIPFGAANGVIVSPPMGNGIVSSTVNNVLAAIGIATQTLSGYVFGCYED